MPLYDVVTEWVFRYQVEAESHQEAEEQDAQRAGQDWDDATLVAHYIVGLDGPTYVPEGFLGPEPLAVQLAAAQAHARAIEVQLQRHEERIGELKNLLRELNGVFWLIKGQAGNGIALLEDEHLFDRDGDPT